MSLRWRVVRVHPPRWRCRRPSRRACMCTSVSTEVEADMRHRIAIAGERSRSLDYLWRDNRLPRSLKLRLYAASVCSTLTHGSEAWMLTPRALSTLYGFNSRQLPRTTGRSYQEEATTPSYDLLTAVRTHYWLGHTPRMHADRLVRRAVLALGQRDGPPYQPGRILMDTASRGPVRLQSLAQYQQRHRNAQPAGVGPSGHA